jgi:hypothetical protein
MARDMDSCQSITSLQSHLKNVPRTLLHGKSPQDMVSTKDEYYLISINLAVCENIVYIHIETSKNTLMKLYPLLCMA